MNIYSKMHTLGPGDMSELISVTGDTLLLTAVESTLVTDDIAIRIGSAGFKNIPTGFKFKLPAGEKFTSFQLKNTGTASRTFRATAVEGDAAFYNLALAGAITVETQGMVEVTNTPSVTVSGTPNVAVPGGVEVTNTPAVTISGTPNVTVSGTPNVAVPGGVEVTNTPAVTVSGNVAVTVAQQAEIITLLTRIAVATEAALV